MWLQIVLKEANVIRLSVVLDIPDMAAIEAQLAIVAAICRKCIGVNIAMEDSFEPATTGP